MRERAVTMVFDLRAEMGSRRGAIKRVADRLGINPETLRNWVRRGEVDSGRRAGTTSDDARRITELEGEVRELRRANDILKAASAFFGAGARPATAEIVGFIDENKRRFGVEPICGVLADAGLRIAPSTYYAAKRRERHPSARAVRDERLEKEIMRVYKDRKKARGLYGARKIWWQLNRDGIAVARCTVARLMGQLGIAGVSPKRKKPRTTVPDTGTGRPADQLKRDFTADVPNTRWVADVTYVPVGVGCWAYTAFVTDLYAKVIVGWQVACHLRTDLALDALEMAIWAREDQLDEGQLVHHSDRGVQYMAIRYTERLEDIGVIQSVGSKGDSYANAAAESVNSLYKKELIDREGPWKGVDDVRLATADWVSWYNKQRLHSTLGGVPPQEYEDNYYTRQNNPDTLNTTG
ncbi:MAG: IS3 family transposase [Nocardioidaceae bacterium]